MIGVFRFDHPPPESVQHELMEEACELRDYMKCLVGAGYKLRTHVW